LPWPLLAAVARSAAVSDRYKDDLVLSRLLVELADSLSAQAKGRLAERERRFVAARQEIQP
jgi:hypothetical protein